MCHSIGYCRGCLVKTDEGYFGIVKETHAELTTVLLANGLMVELPTDALVGLPVKDGACEDACFVELVDAYEAMQRMRRECRTCPFLQERA